MVNKEFKNFEAKLHDLFGRRTHWLRTQVKKPAGGRPPKFNRKEIDSAIEKLKEISTKCLLQTNIMADFKNHYETKKQWHITSKKGWGAENKKKKFNSWFEKNIESDGLVYIFWGKGKKCLYVGRTIKGKQRPQSHFHRDWFKEARRIDVFTATPKNIPMMECLATHRYNPTQSKIKPSKKKYFKKCPICETHKKIQQEVRSIFRLR